MRVCLICVEFFINKSGGFGRAARTIGRELARHGVEVYAIVPRQGDQGAREVHDGVTVLGFPKSRPWEALRLSREVDADVYHSCEPSMTTVFAMRAMPEKKHVITLRDPRGREDWRKELERPARGRVRVASNWLFEANPLVRRAVRRADGVYSTARYLVPKIERIYGVESAFLPTPVTVPDTVLKAQVPTIGWLARWDRVKRPEVFLQLVERFPGVRFRFGGSALDEDWARHLKATYGAAPNLDWVGRIDQFRDPETHTRFLGGAWIMVNASTKEALPNAFIEAGAHRCAVLAGLDPDGFASAFGYHARPAGKAMYPEAEDFERGLAWLLERDRWRALGERAYEHVRSTFATDVAIREHIEMYRRHLEVAPAEGLKV